MKILLIMLMIVLSGCEYSKETSFKESCEPSKKKLDAEVKKLNREYRKIVDLLQNAHSDCVILGQCYGKPSELTVISTGSDRFEILGQLDWSRAFGTPFNTHCNVGEHFFDIDKMPDALKACRVFKKVNKK